MEDSLKRLFAQVVREEVRMALAIPRPHRWVESLEDPTSGGLSMSRICFGIGFLAIVGVNLASIYMMLAGTFRSEWYSPLTIMDAAAIGSAAGVYGFNSFGGAWKRSLKDALGGILGAGGGEAVEDDTRPPPGGGDD